MPATRLPFQRLLFVLLAALALLVGACATGAGSSPTPGCAGCASGAVTGAPPSPTPGPAFPVTLQDDEGSAVTIAAEPRKIVSLTPASTEIVYALGAGSRVVGKVQDVANFPPESKAVPEVATFSSVDVEKIVSLGADLVISGGSGLSQGDAVQQLRRANIPVLVTYPTTVEDALAGIALVGKAIGAADEGENLAASMRQEIDALSGIAGTADSPRLYYEIDNTNGLFTPPADSIYADMFQLAGADPIAGGPDYTISLEKLVSADPEVILLGDAAYGVTPASVEKRAGWAGMTAVKQHRIYPIDDILVTRPGPRLVDGLRALIAAIHPDLASQLPG